MHNLLKYILGNRLVLFALYFIIIIVIIIYVLHYNFPLSLLIQGNRTAI